MLVLLRQTVRYPLGVPSPVSAPWLCTVTVSLGTRFSPQQLVILITVLVLKVLPCQPLPSPPSVSPLWPNRSELFILPVFSTPTHSSTHSSLSGAIRRVPQYCLLLYLLKHFPRVLTPLSPVALSHPCRLLLFCWVLGFSGQGATPSCHLALYQWFSHFSHIRITRGLVNTQIAGPHSECLVQWSQGGPENLHFCQVPRWRWGCWSRDRHTLRTSALFA